MKISERKKECSRIRFLDANKSEAFVVKMRLSSREGLWRISHDREQERRGKDEQGLSSFILSADFAMQGLEHHSIEFLCSRNFSNEVVCGLCVREVHILCFLLLIDSPWIVQPVKNQTVKNSRNVNSMKWEIISFSYITNGLLLDSFISFHESIVSFFSFHSFHFHSYRKVFVLEQPSKGMTEEERK